MAAKLTGKVALVTGASKGIGASIAKHLAAEGASVVVNYSSSKEGAEKVVREITSKGGKAIAVKASVDKPEEVKTLLAETKKAYGHLDILVNNAGVYDFKPLEEITVEHYRRIYDINVLGLILTTQEAAKILRQGGSVINVSSVVATKAFPGTAVYSSTKAAVDQITRVLALEFGSKKIRVNSINPGMVETEGTASMGITNHDNEFRKQVEAMTPLGRIGQPEDIALATVFLASEDSRWVTGETLYTSGGSR